MNLSDLTREFFGVVDQRIGPFDRPFQFRPFPFDAGGALNFLTIREHGDPFVTYLSWDLLGQPNQKRGSLGRYELLAVCDDEEWCLEILTSIGRQSLLEVLNPGETLDIAAWTKTDATIQGVVFDEALRTHLGTGPRREACGVLTCIGVTRPELAFALRRGGTALVERLKQSGVYPRTMIQRASVDLS